MSQLNVDKVRNRAGGSPVDVPGAIKASTVFSSTGAQIGGAASLLNVSSVTRNGTGDYTVNFTTALSSSTYVVAGTISDPGVKFGQLQAPLTSQANMTASSLRLVTISSSGLAAADFPFNSVQVI